MPAPMMDAADTTRCAARVFSERNRRALIGQRVAEPLVMAVGIAGGGCALAVAGAAHYAPMAGPWFALGAAAGFSLSGST
jgi:hypothetical protein